MRLPADICASLTSAPPAHMWAALALWFFRINEAVLRLVFTVRETGGAGGWLQADERCVQRPGGAAEEQISTLCREHNRAGKVEIIISA